MRSLCKVSSTLKVPKFPMTTALQHSKLLSADFSRLRSLTGHWFVPFISVPRFPRFDDNATLRVDRLKPMLQLNHALDLFRKRQIGKIAATLRLGVLRFC